MRIVLITDFAYYPTAASVRRVAASIADAPADWIRPGVTPAIVAFDILRESGVQPSRMPKDEFDSLLADFAYLSADDVDDIRDL